MELMELMELIELMGLMDFVLLLGDRVVLWCGLMN
jgi:hypothetical protein